MIIGGTQLVRNIVFGRLPISEERNVRNALSSCDKWTIVSVRTHVSIIRNSWIALFARGTAWKRDDGLRPIVWRTWISFYFVVSYAPEQMSKNVITDGVLIKTSTDGFKYVRFRNIKFDDAIRRTRRFTLSRRIRPRLRIYNCDIVLFVDFIDCDENWITIV